MAANTQPIYPVLPKLGWATLTTANSAYDGTGTVSTVYTAGTSGARIDQLRIKSLGLNTQNVLRVFVNNNATNTVASNNSLIAELTLTATNASQSSSSTDIRLPLDIVLPANYKLNVTIGTTSANGWQITAEGGDY